jgi:hypothetical protein
MSSLLGGPATGKFCGQKGTRTSSNLHAHLRIFCTHASFRSSASSS